MSLPSHESLPEVTELGAVTGLATSGAVVNAPPTAPHTDRRNRKSWSEAEKREFWRRKDVEKKLRKKERAAARQEAMRTEWATLSEEERQRRKDDAAAVHDKRRAVGERLQAESQCRLDNPHTPVLVFDLSFAWCMALGDTKSTVSQIKFSYSTLRKTGFPFRPVVTSLMGKEREDAEHDASRQAELLAVLKRYEGFAKFPPQMTETQHWSELFPIERVVFLSADAEEVLESIEDDTVYIIGAFVDHNRHKGLSRAAAERHGVRVAKLPIKESIELGNRCLVLTINHVVDVMTAFKASQDKGDGRGDWKSALETALPVRRVQQDALGSRKRRRQLKNGALSGSASVSDEPPHTPTANDGDPAEEMQSLPDEVTRGGDSL